jgi:hypothetical protein
MTCIRSMPHVLIERKKSCSNAAAQISEIFSLQSMIPKKPVLGLVSEDGHRFSEKIVLKTK